MRGRKLGLLALLLIWSASPLWTQSGQFRRQPGFESQFRPVPVRGPIFKRPELVAQDPFGLPHLARAAGIIFSGKVTAISRNHADGHHALDTVAITFRVENAIRGTTPGQTLTIRQWLGLWSSGQLYRPGERVLLFLYPQSKLGLTSCVGASLGRFNMDAAGLVLVSTQQLSALVQDPVLRGKSRIRFSDFARAVKRASEKEWAREGGDHDN